MEGTFTKEVYWHMHVVPGQRIGDVLYEAWYKASNNPGEEVQFEFNDKKFRLIQRGNEND
jgi:hypothetical protein